MPEGCGRCRDREIDLEAGHRAVIRGPGNSPGHPDRPRDRQEQRRDGQPRGLAGRSGDASEWGHAEDDAAGVQLDAGLIKRVTGALERDADLAIAAIVEGPAGLGAELGDGHGVRIADLGDVLRQLGERRPERGREPDNGLSDVLAKA